MAQKRQSAYAFPLFIGLMLTLLIVIYGAFSGDPPSASAQEQPIIPKGEDSRQPGAGEIRVEGWLSMIYGDPQPDSGLPGVRLVTLQDSSGNDLVEVAMPEGTLQTLYGQYVEVIGTPRAESRALNGTLLNARQVTPIAPQRGEGLRDVRVSGSQPWINLLCRFSDRPAEPNAPAFYQALFGTAYPGLDHYWRQISYNIINLNGTATVTAWRAMPQPRSFYITGSGSNTTANLTALRNDCISVHDADVFFPSFIGINMFFNDSLDCCAWGGGASVNVDGQTKFYRTTYLPPWAANHSVIAHEMGHGYGFPHSTGPANNPPTGLNVYVSQWDVMSDANGTGAVSVSGYGALAPGTISYHLRMAQWIPSGRIVTVGSGQDVTLTLERTVLPQSTTNPLMAIVPFGSSTSQFYTVEVRNINAGYDQNIPASAVIIHDVNTGRSGNGGHAYVVDADTTNTNTNDAGARWLPGETYIDAGRGISIEVLSQSGSTFTVRIINGSSNPTPTPPPPAPANDLFPNARPVSPGSTYTQEWLGATDSASDPRPSCAPFAGTVWYRFTAPSSGSITIDTIGTTSGSGGVDTVLAVYTGTEGNLTEVACNDDTSGSLLSRVTYTMQQGTTYHIVVGRYGSTPPTTSTTLYLNLSGISATNTPTRTPTRTPTPTVTPTIAPGTNLVRNGNFNNGGTPPNTPPQFWSIFGAPINPIWNVTGGVFQFYRQMSSTQGVIFQNLGVAIPSGTMLEARVDLGNSSGQRKRAVIMLHDANFSDLFICSFWLPPNTPLTQFRMTGRAQRNWANATISIYASMADNLPHLRVDNAYVATIPNDGSGGVLCYDAFAP
jgi:hypothetical protein